jgi:Ni/Co efflux regulator RcnB
MKQLVAALVAATFALGSFAALAQDKGKMDKKEGTKTEKKMDKKKGKMEKKKAAKKSETK